MQPAPTGETATLRQHAGRLKNELIGGQAALREAYASMPLAERLSIAAMPMLAPMTMVCPPIE